MPARRERSRVSAASRGKRSQLASSVSCCGARALAKAIEMSDGEAVRKKEKLRELVEQKESAQRQTGEIISSKAELDTIYDEARKYFFRVLSRCCLLLDACTVPCVRAALRLLMPVFVLQAP